MYSLIISGATGIVIFLALFATGLSAWYWALVFGIVALIATNLAIGRVIGARLKTIAENIQGGMITAQKRMQEKMNVWRFRPPGSLKQAQLEIAKFQHAAIVEALEASKAMEKYRNWSPMMGRQIATMRMQLHYQDKNWKAVDELIPRCLAFDHMTASMIIARTYMREGYKHETDKKGRTKANAIDKSFERGAARLRYGQGAVLYGLYAWIQVQAGDADSALETLLRADRKMENSTVKRNIELLRNNKPKQFSLAGLGDEWYALGLEEPRFKTPRSHERIRM